MDSERPSYVEQSFHFPGQEAVNITSWKYYQNKRFSINDALFLCEFRDVTENHREKDLVDGSRN